jgi:hypothetical protein
MPRTRSTICDTVWLWRIRHADARKQQPHVIVDLGDRADRRAWIAAGGLLLNGDRRRQPVDVVDIGLLHHLEELPRIGRQALDIAALALGIDGVESQRRFSGARQPREDDQRIPGDRQIDVLEVVLARTAHVNRVRAGLRARTGFGLGFHGRLWGAGHGGSDTARTYPSSMQPSAAPTNEGILSTSQRIGSPAQKARKKQQPLFQ